MSINNMSFDMASTVKTSTDVVLKVEHVAKSFRLPTEQASGLKQAIINWARGTGAT